MRILWEMDLDYHVAVLDVVILDVTIALIAG